ncbi:protein of unknown function [Paenibacillus uliginis N3/975]|uniref:DUF4179 domain-containing protein n=1 Tax=Paenibacillus uliginis N3/975 TaxID=1313296 RepID=A0A1X7GAH3_9BACL|nr:DUF4179 domain-containing protein [Paenibacillus uliginis]SMF66708.1 protein of unknown function [Paenibacillus uliginis N3/975]
MNTRIKLEDKDFNQLQSLIRETPIEVDLVERTMEKYAEVNSKAANSRVIATRNKNRAGKTIIAVASAFLILMGSGFISPTMAASIKQIPGINSIFKFAGDLGLKTADEKGLVTTVNSSDSHDNLKLNVPVVMFDGTRVSIGIEHQSSVKKYLDKNMQELISSIELFINGEPVNSYAPANTSNSIDPYIIPSIEDNSAIIQFSDRHNQGGNVFPDKFDLTLKISVLGIQEPFEIDIPVEKNTKDNLALNPSISRQYENINLKLDKVEFTPITTSLTTRIELSKNLEIASSLPLLGYDIFDEKGNKLKLINANGWNPTDGNVMITDSRFEPFESIPKSITIKTYKYLYKNENRNQFELDSNGIPKIEYLPDLEITLPITLK